MADGQLDKSTIESLRKACKENLFFLARAVLGFQDLDEYVHLPICKMLEDYEVNTKTIIVLPRDWFKSSVGSVAYTIWRAIKNPNIRILICQNSHSNACKKLQAIKQLFEKCQLLRALFPEILPTSSNRWSSECLELNRTAAHPEGTFEAAGTGTAVTSRHYDLIIEDDTVAPEKDALKGLIQQPTQLEIEKAIGWHKLAMPLQIHPTKSQRVVIGTRWAERDLIGHILEEEPEYKLITRSALKPGKTTISAENIVWSRYDVDVLRQVEKAIGPYMFSTLFLNLPINDIDAIFKRDWIQYFDTISKAEQHRMLYCTSVDPAASDSAGSSDPDYNVVITTGIDPKTGMVYVVKISRARMNPGELITAILDHQEFFHPVVVKIESIAYQRTLNYWLKRTRERLNRRFYVEEVKSHGSASKKDRIRALQPFFADKLISIRTHMGELERELLGFPNGAHDDIIDALSMHVGFWARETEAVKREKKKELITDEMSGVAVIEELLKRPNEFNTYPYDIGHMSERANAKKIRNYNYA